MFDFLWTDTQFNGISDIAPPLELYSQYFSSELNYEYDKVPNDLINFDIALVSLAKSKNLDDQVGLNYIAKFLTCFCPDSIEYTKLSKEGKERIDSIFSSSSQFFRKAIQISGCNQL